VPVDELHMVERIEEISLSDVDLVVFDLAITIK